MYTFNVERVGQSLIVNTNTFWSCNVYGNFTLSKYSGDKKYINSKCSSETIDIIIPKELPSARGEIVFSYGDERCEYPSISVFLINECYIRTEPMFVETSNGERIIRIKYKEENESVSIKIYSNGIWTANGSGLFTNGDELLITAGECKEVTISPNIGCDDYVINIVGEIKYKYYIIDNVFKIGDIKYEIKKDEENNKEYIVEKGKTSPVYEIDKYYIFELNDVKYKIVKEKVKVVLEKE